MLNSLLMELKILASSTSFGDGAAAMWEGLGKALAKVKEGVYAIMPETMIFLGDAWPILLVIAVSIVWKILFAFLGMLNIRKV
ncbi:hypothetical protein [Spiroplasma endosymbiont of Dilophus febrilis]|uniref:hypothetical protein n=1 Tax=Spiroplasma endosymbiont of Dilophus febrilis TaxID=3066292 RepID=UPI00313BB6CD